MSIAPTLEDLLGRGYLPQELPPPFSSTSFGAYAKSLTAGKLPFDTITKGFKTSRPEVYNLARAGSFRRELSILNPIHFAELAQCFVNNWPKLASLTKSKLSLTSPTPTKEGRAISRKFALDSLPNHRANTRNQGTFLLKADVIRFYPSIYTHSVPWAVHGKAFAKANRDPKHLGNKLDLLLRNCQDAQTNGIPVGPDTSLVIAELLLAQVDRSLLRRRCKGFRYMDDYELVFDSEKRALEARSDLQEALLGLELDLSATKTAIGSLPRQLEDGWVSSLSLFELFEGSPFFKTQIIRFFDCAFELARKYPHEGVLKYAAGRISKLKLDGADAELVENLLMQCAQVEAGALSFVLASMLRNPPSSSAKQKQRHVMLLRIIDTHSAQRHSSEVAWAIWACITMKLRLPRSAVRAVLKMEDSVCALLALHARRLKLIDEPNDLRSLRDAMNASALYGPRWLLAYEANVKGWFRFKGAIDYVAQDRNFRHLKNGRVSFYEEAKTVLPEEEPARWTRRAAAVEDYLSRIAIGYGDGKGAEDERGEKQLQP